MQRNRHASAKTWKTTFWVKTQNCRFSGFLQHVRKTRKNTKFDPKTTTDVVVVRGGVFGGFGGGKNGPPPGGGGILNNRYFGGASRSPGLLENLRFAPPPKNPDFRPPKRPPHFRGFCQFSGFFAKMTFFGVFVILDPKCHFTENASPAIFQKKGCVTDFLCTTFCWLWTNRKVSTNFHRDDLKRSKCF